METKKHQIDRRLRNELLFRSVNEKLRGLNVEFEGFVGERAVFVCECARLDCIEQIELAVETFDEICSAGDRFLVIPGHETAELEHVVSSASRYLVVEKHSADN